MAPLTLASLFRPLLVQCIVFLDKESIRQACFVSKQWHALVRNHPLLEHKLIPMVQISADKNNKGDKGRVDRLFENLQRHSDKLQFHRKVQVIVGHKFRMYDWDRTDNILKTLQLYGVVSLDVSSPILERSPISFYDALARILPNLQEIDVSNTEGQPSSVIRAFSRECPRLEKITCNNTNQILSSASIDGEDVMGATNLKEMYMDNAVFDVGYNIRGNDEHSHIFLFYKCGSKVLERISIQNARYYEFLCSEIVPFPQNALIKFIRHAPPSLRWFRSDLTQENIGMLRSERPNIEFVH